MKTLAAVLAPFVIAIGIAPAHSASLAAFGPDGKTKCQACEASLGFRQSISVRIPEHAIVLDFGNGVFWRNSKLVVVDLDAAETLSYQFPPEQDRRTELRLTGRNALPPEKLQDLIIKAKSIWNPPPLKTSGVMLPRTDVFETMYVVNGPVLARWISNSEDPAWYVALTEAVRSSEAPINPR